MRIRLMTVITNLTRYYVLPAGGTDSEMLHEFLCENDVNDYTVTFEDFISHAEYQKMRSDYDNEIATMRSEYEEFKRTATRMAEFLNSQMEELKTHRDELIKDVDRLSGELSQLSARKQALAENYTRACEHMDDKNREIANLKLRIRGFEADIKGMENKSE